MVRRHHLFSGHEFEQTPGDLSKLQTRSVGYSPRGHQGVGHVLATKQQQQIGNYDFPDLVAFHGDFNAPYKLSFCALHMPVHSSLSGWSCGALAMPTQMTWSSKLAVV